MAVPALAVGGAKALRRTRKKTPLIDMDRETRTPIYCRVQKCVALGDGNQECGPWIKVYPGGSHTFTDGQDSITITFGQKCEKTVSGNTENPLIGFPTERVYRSEDLVMGAISRLFEFPRPPNYH
ncbi:uncharacterized protein PpBr36_10191 [Pyricularia pennisetigena]|uniref:uncharacterized protein n=1 Tax=Pyricularia pennisetigena TaxID=1578925 RepID=UPI0011539CBF|nr:uncharacterized protein PpBr36_10191 [Pyricularia pennisetigena]TLS21546.1 hypothetical protein PpBr36_10191 [Pyricularia pennisetigena]